MGKQLGLAQAAHYCFLNVATTSGCSYKATRSRVYLQLEVKIYNDDHIFQEVQKTCTKYKHKHKYIKSLKTYIASALDDCRGGSESILIFIL